MRVVRAFVEGGAGAAPLVVLHGPARSGKSLLVEWACSLAGPRAFRLDLDRVRAGKSRGLVPRKPLVVADGVERLAGRAAAQRVLCSILDAVCDRGDRVLVALEGHPATREGLSVALRDRLRGGLVVPLAEPGRAELRLQLRERARRRGRRLPPRWEEELVAMGAKDALLALDRRLDGDADGAPAPPRSPLERLKEAAARAFGVERALLDGPSKRRTVVEARRAVMSAAMGAGAGAAEVAAAFGLASTRAVREALRWCERAAERDRRFAALLQEVRRGW
jgi:chromosomal replication initiation ATPase DnaA